MKKYFVLIAMVCGMLVSCTPDPTLPTVTTNLVEQITDTSAFCTGEIIDDGNADITAKGFCWSTNQNPTLEDNYTTDITRKSPAVNYFASNIYGLTEGTEYYVRAFATNSVGTAYGDAIKFATLEASPETPETPETPEDPETPETPEDPETPENNYEFVDLGLPSGVKWASYNVGATASYEWGSYYSWGEIATKEEYSINNCTSYTKDLGDISANPEYDVVAAEWGGNWRMPKLEDMYELVTQCDWIWDVVNGVGGFNVVSKENGNHIFLPASGFMNANASAASGGETTTALDQGVWGYYWTSTPYSEEVEGGTNTNKRACFLTFSSAGYMTDQGLRFNGFTIRPVMD